MIPNLLMYCHDQTVEYNFATATTETSSSLIYKDAVNDEERRLNAFDITQGCESE